MADDLKLAHHNEPVIEEVGLKEKIMLEFSPELRKQKFDENIKAKYPNATIHGHREFAAKTCPSFDAKYEYKDL